MTLIQMSKAEESITENDASKIVLLFEREQVEIPLNYEDKKDKILSEAFFELQQRVSHLEKELQTQKILTQSNPIRDISDEMAEEELFLYIKTKKASGIKKISIIDLVTDLYLPADQIERVMERLVGRKMS